MKYLKVKKDICPRCNKEREIVVYGDCNKRGTFEIVKGIAGYKCFNCGDVKLLIIKRMKTFTFLNDDGAILDTVEAETHEEAVANACEGIEYNTCYSVEDPKNKKYE